MRVRRAQPGQALVCRQCGCRFAFPTSADLAADAQADQARRRHATRVAVFGVLGGLLLVLAVIVAVWASGSRGGPQPADRPKPAGDKRPDPPSTALQLARQYIQERFADRMDRATRTPETQDDVQLAGGMADWARQIRPERPLHSALLFAHAARMLAASGGHYTQACEALDEAVASVIAFDPNPQFRVQELDHAQKAIDATPEAKTQPARPRRPRFFGQQ